MKKSLFIGFFLAILLILSACDGINSTSQIELKSIFDGHETTLTLKSDVKGFNYGDILSPTAGKAKFNTKLSRKLETLTTEIRKYNTHLTVDVITEDTLSILETTSEGNTYSYFLKFLRTIGKRNEYIIGEQRFRIDSIDQKNLLVFLPCHMLDDKKLNESLDTYQSVNINRAFSLREGSTIEQFLAYYDMLNWVQVEQNEQTLVMTGFNESVVEKKHRLFVDSLTLSFHETGMIYMSVALA